MVYFPGCDGVLHFDQLASERNYLPSLCGMCIKCFYAYLSIVMTKCLSIPDLL